MIDIHCHLLPEVDDGPKSWDVAVEMCRMAAADGITHAVATPHANDRYAYDRAYLSGLLGELREKTGASLELTLGCDFHLSFENLERVLEQPHTFTIGETNYLLIELSNFSVPTQLADCFVRLGDRGLTPILTHPERNPILQQTPHRILEWVEQGCLVQVTSSALTGFWGERPEIVARWLLDRSAVHFLASDAHDTRRQNSQSFRRPRRRRKDCGSRICRSSGARQSRRDCQRTADPLLPTPSTRLAHPQNCHPERRPAESEAIGWPQSKDPYPIHPSLGAHNPSNLEDPASSLEGTPFQTEPLTPIRAAPR